MKIYSITIALLATISSPSYAAFQEREYNTWYQKDAVLYDITQTSEGLPVMISISQPGRESANMLVSYMSDGGCGDKKVRLNANGKDVPATYTCVSVGANRIEHFALMNPLMILVKIIKLRWIHILSYDQMVSRKINNQTTRCANSIF
ncbi:hypothetical protein, partial [Enterobacter hormaechei]|uniref:hypothetical protein n=1 Tax=Enterobacter hormaechei TaxID=158836 RepID=UPI0033161DA8